jgi:hypothetical protein
VLLCKWVSCGEGWSTGEVCCVEGTGECLPACREDVCEHGEVCFVLCAGGQLEAVEVGKGDADVLSLAALVRAHCYVAVSSACEAGKVSVLETLQSSLL